MAGQILNGSFVPEDSTGGRDTLIFLRDGVLRHEIPNCKVRLLVGHPVYGFGYGGVMTGVLVSVHALVPSAKRASATGIVLAFGWLGHALGGWQGGLFFDITGSYSWSFFNAAFAGSLNLLIVGSIFLWLGRNRLAQA